jgi:hypothetical protein
MTTLLIKLDDSLADAIRQKAAGEGKSPEEWAAGAIAMQAGTVTGDGRHWVDQFQEIADQAQGDSRGQKWTREDLYDR